MFTYAKNREPWLFYYHNPSPIIGYALKLLCTYICLSISITCMKEPETLPIFNPTLPS